MPTIVIDELIAEPESPDIKKRGREYNYFQRINDLEIIDME